ncbi:MAG: 1-acyl-sn-glycerol-3-phosphate acyltransferase, partial [Leptospirales bacterium]|nr:1-acyl-sn-glycerol-3-phosphate acyltransferase [Leptospirales bacterium]
VYPEELESYYKQSDAIEEIAVFARQIDRIEKVYAVIVPTKKNETSYGIVKEEINRLNKRLPSYKIINDFAISFDKLPVNSAKKVVYRDVIKLLEKGVFMENNNDKAILQTILIGQSPAEVEIINILKKRLKTDKLFARQTLADFGIDSLGLVDLIVHLEEKLNITIDTQKLKNLQTIEEIVLYLSSLEKGVEQNIEERIFKSEITEKPLLFWNPFLYIWIWIIKLIFTYIWKFDIVNSEKLDIENNLILSNHASYFDIPIMVKAMLAKDIKNTYAIGKKRVSVVRYVFHGIPVIWVDYEKNANEVFKRSSDLLRQGKSLLIYPEGSRTQDNEMKEFKLGAAYIAKNLNKKIIPVTVNGSFDIWSPLMRFPNFFGRKRGNVIVHDKIDPADFKTVESLNAKVWSVIHSGIDTGINNK